MIPYRQYYEHKLSIIKKQNDTNNQKNNPQKLLTDNTPKLLGKKTLLSNNLNLNSLNSKIPLKSSHLQEELKKIIEEKRLEKIELAELKPPPADQFSISHPNISSLDMDIIKITAQSVARNGQKFMTDLLNREAKNAQFDFLKPQHSLFGYFTYLVESYSKCLLRKPEAENKLTIYANDKNYIIKKATERYLWDKKNRDTQKKKDALSESEKLQMMQIDWNDFIVVDLITFNEDEMENTVPINTQGNINLNINSFEANVNMSMQEFINNEKESKLQVYETPKILEPLPEPGMKIVKNYTRKSRTESTQEMLKCPLCKENIPANELDQHMSIELLDPKWIELKKEVEKNNEKKNIVQPNEFLNYLGEFSKSRPDLFSDVKSAANSENNKKIEVKTGNEIWDGYAPNMSRTTANIAMLIKQTKKNLEQTSKNNDNK